MEPEAGGSVLSNSVTTTTSNSENNLFDAKIMTFLNSDENSGKKNFELFRQFGKMSRD